MGVQGLWEVLQPAARAVPLTRLALDAFDKAGVGQGPDGSDTGIRALRIGVDASLWIFHARTVAGGSNPLLRTLMFRTLKLLAHPVAPVFVFDGPNKPLMKRGKQVGGRWGQDAESRLFKNLLDQCGWDWWDAPGEAEAELALMSRQRKVDVVMTDDVDALVFGSTIVLRNPSRTLSGYSKSTATAPVFETREDYQVYTLAEIAESSPAGGEGAAGGETGLVGLNVDQLIFIALCSGGDYHPAGIPGCGMKIAVGLARSGLAKELLHCYRTASPEAFALYLPAFVDALKRELATNASGFLPNKRKALAASLPPEFPDLVVLEHYVRPAVSPDHGGWPGFTARNRFGRGDPRGWARACEKWFEWGYAEEIGRKLRTLAWRGEIVAGAGARLGMDGHKEETARRRERSGEGVSAGRGLALTMSPFPPARLIRIHAERTHRSTDSTPEYRVEYDPLEWTTIALDAIDGTRPRPESLSAEQRDALGMVPLVPPSRLGYASQSSASEYEPSSEGDDVVGLLSPRKQRQRKEVDLASSEKVWIPKSIIDVAYPDLVEAYQADLREKELRKTPVKKARPVAPTQPKRRPADPIADKQRTLMAGWLTSAKPSDTPRAPLAVAASPTTPLNRIKPVEIIEIEDSPDRTPRQAAVEGTIGRAEPAASRARQGDTRCAPQPAGKRGVAPTPDTAPAAKTGLPTSSAAPIIIDLADEDDDAVEAELQEVPEVLEDTPPRQRLARSRSAASRSGSAETSTSAPPARPSRASSGSVSRAPASRTKSASRTAPVQGTLAFLQERSAVADKPGCISSGKEASKAHNPPATKRASVQPSGLETALATARPRRKPVKFRLLWEDDAEARYEQVTPTASPAAPARVSSARKLKE